MKTSLRKILSFILVLCVAFVCLNMVNVTAATATGKDGYTYEQLTSTAGIISGETYMIAGEVEGTSYFAGATDTKFENTTDSASALLFVITKVGDNYTIQNSEDNKYVGYSSSTNFKNNATYAEDGAFDWTIQEGVNGTFRIANVKTNTRALVYRAGTTNKFGAYATSNVTAGSTEYYDVELYIKKTVEEDETINAIKSELNLVDSKMSLGYKYAVEDNGAEKITESTISFADKAQRTSFSTSEQVWEQNGITVTNAKGSSTSNVADYANPARFYKSSTLTIAYTAAFSSIEFDCNSGTYATDLAKSEVEGGTWTISSDKATLTFGTPVDTVTFTLSGGQVRMDSIIVCCIEGGRTFSDVDFRIRCGVKKTLADLDVESYGIKVTANGKSKLYENGSEFLQDDDAEYLYVTISLGDVLTNSSRLDAEFTVQAYVVVDGLTYVSEKTTTYSVVTLVKEYYGMAATKEVVTDLYNLLIEMGKITE